MKKRSFTKGLIYGSVLGTIAMYFYDPHHGKRRRVQMRDQSSAFGRDLMDFVRKMGQDAKNRFQGIKARTRRMIPKMEQGSGMKQQAPAEGSAFPS